MATSSAPLPSHSPPLEERGFTVLRGDRLLQYWESEATRPRIEGSRPEGRKALEHAALRLLPPTLTHPFLPPETVDRQQFERIANLVERAFEAIPLYREKYGAVGFRKGDLRSWADFERLPVVTKDELMAAFPEGCMDPRWDVEDCFSTRTFGSSGKTLIIKVNQEAILVDTLQGARQFWLQSGLRYQRHHRAAMIYTVPWWFESIGDDFPSAFLSGLLSPTAMATILEEVNPEVLSCYPTNLMALLGRWKNGPPSKLLLAVVHSETSTREERARWSKELGVPVLDEYSSEEGTRIALELPCGHYHVCEDAVRLEVLDPKTRTPQAPGVPGIAVITNLLNEAMPFLRYVQGDYVTRPADSAGSCLLGWSRLDSVDGRVNDSFRARDGREVPSGTILDVVYRWMFDAGVPIAEFELVQTGPSTIRALFQVDESVPELRVTASMQHLNALLNTTLGHPVQVVWERVAVFPKRTGKRRPIRREFLSS